MTEAYDFRTQMMKMYDLESYQYVVEMFDQLPLAATVNGDYLALHGGVSERLKSLAMINEIDRTIEPQEECLMNDLLWADPIIGDAALEQREIFNEARSTSVRFGKQVLEELLEAEGLKALIRAHEEEGEGYKFYMWDKKINDPKCITIFSAPNYCNHENRASIFLASTSEKSKVLTYGESPYNMYYLRDR